mmetsp:Transcript_41348/g.130127  ORF Transcript_41348/g.130127 Transcript_41348/m.130127 type:complete len:582 (-) Transcript_41348:1376-3121(-)
MNLNRTLIYLASAALALFFLVLMAQMRKGSTKGIDTAMVDSLEGYPSLTKFVRQRDPRLPMSFNQGMAAQAAMINNNPQMAKQLLEEYRKSNQPAFDWRQSEAQAQRVMAAMKILQNVLGASSPELLVALPKGLQDVLFRSAISAVASPDPNQQRLQNVLRSARNLGYLKPGMVQGTTGGTPPEWGSQAKARAAEHLQRAKLRKHLLLKEIDATSSENRTITQTDPSSSAPSFLVNYHPKLDRALEKDDRIALDWMVILLLLLFFVLVSLLCIKHMLPKMKSRAESIIHSARGEKRISWNHDPSKPTDLQGTSGVLDAVLTGGKEFVARDLVEGIEEMAGDALAFTEFWDVESTDESMDVIISYDPSSDGIFGQVLANAIFEEYTRLDFAALLLPSEEDALEREAQMRAMQSVAGCRIFIALVSDEWMRRDQNIKLLAMVMHCVEAHRGNKFFLIIDQKMKFQNEIHSSSIKLSSVNSLVCKGSESVQKVVRVLQKRGFLDQHDSEPIDAPSEEDWNNMMSGAIQVEALLRSQIARRKSLIQAAEEARRVEVGSETTRESQASAFILPTFTRPQIRFSPPS